MSVAIPGLDHIPWRERKNYRTGCGRRTDESDKCFCMISHFPPGNSEASDAAESGSFGCEAKRDVYIFFKRGIQKRFLSHCI